jgi:hypothetical protein
MMLVIAAGAGAPAAIAAPPAGSVGIRLVDVPVNSANDPRAREYIIDIWRRERPLRAELKSRTALPRHCRSRYIRIRRPLPMAHSSAVRSFGQRSVEMDDDQHSRYKCRCRRN